MQTSEKKLGCLEGTKRANMPNVGTIEGSVNVSLTKGGKKQISIDKEGKVIFWIVNDFDVIVSPEDVVDCKLIGSGRYIMGGKNLKQGEQTIREYWYGTKFELTFADGTTGVLAVKVFSVAGSDVWKPGFGEIPKVDGWLAPGGERDEHYKDAICPKGYTPNVVGYYKKGPGSNQLAKIDNALKLSERFPGFASTGVPEGLYTNDGGKSTHYVFG